MKNKFNKYPSVKVSENYKCCTSWNSISEELLQKLINKKNIVVIETYHGVYDDEIISEIKNGINPKYFINAQDAMLSEDEIKTLVYPDVTDDRIFGFLTNLQIEQFFNVDKIKELQDIIDSIDEGVIVVYGIGASLICGNPTLLVYADMARWEIQLRFRKNEISNLGITNPNEDFARQYKQAFFVDWRVLDRLKKRLFENIDYLLDTNKRDTPKMISGKALLDGLKQTATQPFSVVPFFDPGPWGGQWMKDFCNLDKDAENYAWCFNGVPEENSLLLEFDGETVEIPSINVVFYQPEELLGEMVHGRFGDEFPIRFDFLDTFDGGNLSLQVHPLTEYIQEHFGMHYTQDESYYMLDAKPDAEVYLGLRDDVNPKTMIAELREAQNGGKPFDAKKHVQTFPAKKHDHFLIPAGTVHCSGINGMVLEISATPYIFTFKLWDWGRLGLDGLPRPINIEHGEKVIKWNRTKLWTEKHLVNQVEVIAEGDGWREERTGLHEREFIETRRHWFTKKVLHNSNGGVHMLNLIEGDEAIVESPKNKFKPFVVNYAETFIIPAMVGEYTIRPFGESEGKECATILAYVRG
ncbi:MAG: class I mannose-6-phosphate isomerase [Melioribacteraceae bacterium]|nr:class I mannose-6-phosphate isomerase [Melioribacteraceae bacterium]